MNICMLSDMVKKETRMPLIPDDIIELKNTLTKFNFYIEKFTDRIIDLILGKLFEFKSSK